MCGLLMPYADIEISVYGYQYLITCVIAFLIQIYRLLDLKLYVNEILYISDRLNLA